MELGHSQLFGHFLASIFSTPFLWIISWLRVWIRIVFIKLKTSREERWSGRCCGVSPERDMTWQEDDNPGSGEPRAGTKGGLRRTVTQSVNCYSSLITAVIKRPSEGSDEKTKQTQHSLRLQSNPITERGSPQDWPSLHTRNNLFREQKNQLNHFYCFIR